MHGNGKMLKGNYFNVDIEIHCTSLHQNDTQIPVHPLDHRSSIPGYVVGSELPLPPPPPPPGSVDRRWSWRVSPGRAPGLSLTTTGSHTVGDHFRPFVPSSSRDCPDRPKKNMIVSPNQAKPKQ